MVAGWGAEFRDWGAWGVSGLLWGSFVGTSCLVVCPGWTATGVGLGGDGFAAEFLLSVATKNAQPQSTNRHDPTPHAEMHRKQ